MCVQAQGRLSSAHPPCPKQLRSVKCVYNPNDRYHPPPPHPKQLRSSKCVHKPKEGYHPPTHPAPNQLLSVKCVYNPKNRYHPHPPLASNLCTSPRNVITHTPTHPTPNIKGVYKPKEGYHPARTPPQTLNCLASNVCTSPRNVITPPPQQKRYNQPSTQNNLHNDDIWWSMMQISFLGRVAAAGPSACAWACGALRCTSSSPSPTNRTGGEKRVPCFLFDSFSPSRVFLVTGKCTKRCEKELIAWLFQDFQYVVSLESLEMIYDFTF